MTVEFLSQEQIELFRSEGFLVIPNFLDRQQCQQLKEETIHIVAKQYDPKTHSTTVFSTERDNEAQAKAAYFLESGDKIRFFFEEKAASNPEQKTCNSVLLSLNKIGHALHIHNDKFHGVSHGDQRIAAILRDLKYKKPVVLQSMVIFKHPGVGGNVIPHQDSTFLYTEPQSAIGFWFALDDCTTENGSLIVYPGSHLAHPTVKSRFVRDDGIAKFVGTKSETLQKEWTDSLSPKLLTVDKGALVLIHGSLVHESGENLSNHQSRYAYTFHCIETEPPFQYPSNNWLQSKDPRVFKPLYTTPPSNQI